MLLEVRIRLEDVIRCYKKLNTIFFSLYNILTHKFVCAASFIILYLHLGFSVKAFSYSKNNKLNHSFKLMHSCFFSKLVLNFRGK